MWLLPVAGVCSFYLVIKGRVNASTVNDNTRLDQPSAKLKPQVICKLLSQEINYAVNVNIPSQDYITMYVRTCMKMHLENVRISGCAHKVRVVTIFRKMLSVL